jgi:hypothetical protein
MIACSVSVTSTVIVNVAISISSFKVGYFALLFMRLSSLRSNLHCPVCLSGQNQQLDRKKQ